MPGNLTQKITLEGIRSGLAYMESMIRIYAGYQESTEARTSFLKDVYKDLMEITLKVKDLTKKPGSSSKSKTTLSGGKK